MLHKENLRCPLFDTKIILTCSQSCQSIPCLWQIRHFEVTEIRLIDLYKDWHNKILCLSKSRRTFWPRSFVSLKIVLDWNLISSYNFWGLSNSLIKDDFVPKNKDNIRMIIEKSFLKLKNHKCFTNIWTLLFT